MSDWFPIETAPRDGTSIMLWDGIAVSPAMFSQPYSAEEWWEVVGDEDDDFDAEGYAEYLAEEPDGWVILNGPNEGVEFSMTPVLWQPYPKPPVFA